MRNARGAVAVFVHAHAHAMRQLLFDIAHGSAWETNAVLDIARCCGFDAVEDRAARALAGRVAAMTTVLVRRR